MFADPVEIGLFTEWQLLWWQLQWPKGNPKLCPCVHLCKFQDHLPWFSS